MQFIEILGQRIISIDEIHEHLGNAKGIELHRNILIQKRLKLTEAHLKKTKYKMGSRFTSLFLTYATENWPSATSELFDDTLNFINWIETLPDKDLRRNILKTEQNWLTFQKSRLNFEIKKIPVSENLLSYQVMFRINQIPKQLVIGF